MKRILALTLAVMMTAMLLAGCQPGNDTATPSPSPVTSTGTADPIPSQAQTDEEIDILWFHHFGEEGLRIWAEWVAGKVTELYPNVHVGLEVVSSDKYMQLLNTKIASEDAPAMFDLGSEVLLQEFVDAGHLYEITDVPYLTNIREEVIKGGSLKDGRVFACQISLIAYGGYYNKNVFDNVGITDIPQTWDAFIAMLQKIKDAGVAPIAGGFQEVWTLGAMFQCAYQPHVLAQDPDFFTGAAAGDKLFADNAEFVAALQRLGELMPYLNEDPFGSDANKSYELVGTGNAAMLWNGSWAVEAIKAKDPAVVVGHMAMPKDEDPNNALIPMGSAGGFCVYNFADANYIDAGLKLHETMLSAESAGMFQDTAIQIGSAKGLDMSFENAFMDVQKCIDEGRVVSYAGLNVSYGTEEDQIFREELTKFAMAAYDGNIDAAGAAASFDAAFAGVVS